MRKIFLAVVAATMVLTFANISFAHVEQDVEVTTGDNNIDTRVDNDLTATGGTGIGTGGAATATVGNTTATGGNANQQQDQRQKQLQKQKQDQKQLQKQKTTVTGVKGNQTVTSPLQAQMLGAVVGPGGAEVGKEFMLRCNPAYQSFTIEELENMADSGGFYDKRGSFFDAMFGNKIKPHVRSKKSSPSSDTIRILNKVPNAKVLGTFSCTGDYGWGLDEVLSKCLLEARERTNTSNVVVWKTNDIDAANSGTATGAGTGMSDAYGAGNVGAGAVGATFGKTHSMKERVILLEVFAYDDVYEAPNVCGPQPQITKVTAPPAEKPEPQVKACDPSSIWSRIHELEKLVEKCTRWCYNNLQLRSKLGEAFIDLYQCTGDERYLGAAIEHFKIAEHNYLKGFDIKANRVKANQLIAQDYYFWAGCINTLQGSDAADRFATEKRVEKVPQL